MEYYVLVIDGNPLDASCITGPRHWFSTLREARHYAACRVEWFGFASIYDKNDECIDEFAPQ